MSSSFYGGQPGHSFIMRPNQFNGNAQIWSEIGTPNDSKESLTVYGGIKRGDVKPGEYVMVKESGKNVIYRIGMNGTPICTGELPSNDSEGFTIIYGYNENISDQVTQEVYYIQEQGVQSPARVFFDTISVECETTGNTAWDSICDFRNSGFAQHHYCYNFHEAGQEREIDGQMVDLRNYLHVYQGGVLPPAMTFTDNVTVFQKGTDGSFYLLPAGFYIFLESGLFGMGSGFFPVRKGYENTQEVYQPNQTLGIGFRVDNGATFDYVSLGLTYRKVLGDGSLGTTVFSDTWYPHITINARAVGPAYSPVDISNKTILKQLTKSCHAIMQLQY